MERKTVKIKDVVFKVCYDGKEYLWPLVVSSAALRKNGFTYEEEHLHSHTYLCAWKCPVCGGVLSSWYEDRQYGNGPWYDRELQALEEMIMNHEECFREVFGFEP